MGAKLYALDLDTDEWGEPAPRALTLDAEAVPVWTAYYDEVNARIQGEDVRNLLDHIKVSNRDMINQRLDELSREQDGLESQLASLNQAMLEEDKIQELVQDTLVFALSLDSTLHHGSPDQRRTLLRRCVDRIAIDHQNKQAEVKLRVLPIGLNCQAAASTKTVVVELAKKVSPNGRCTCQSGDK